MPRAFFAFLALITASPALAVEMEFGVVFNDTVLSGSEGPAVGDRVILNDRLTIDGVDTGFISGVCTITDLAGLMHCTANFALNDGTISTQFVNTPDPEKLFSLFGGTGAYEGLTGFGVLVEHGDGTGTLTLTVDE